MGGFLRYLAPRDSPHRRYRSLLAFYKTLVDRDERPDNPLAKIDPPTLDDRLQPDPRAGGRVGRKRCAPLGARPAEAVVHSLRRQTHAQCVWSSYALVATGAGRREICARVNARIFRAFTRAQFSR